MRFLMVLVAALLVACGGTPPRPVLKVDTPLLPFVALDADELAGIEEDEEETTPAPESAPVPTPKK